MGGEHRFQAIQAQVIGLARVFAERKTLPPGDQMVVDRKARQHRQRVTDSENEVERYKQRQRFKNYVSEKLSIRQNGHPY